jgi:hypothetical protein
MQSFLARLYVDAPFRRLFHADSDSLLAEYELDGAEKQALLGLNAGMLDYFAASLLHKRRKRVEHAYPLLFRLNRPAMERLFARFHQLFHARPRQTVIQDALDFGEFVEQSVVDTAPWPEFCPDLARYERLYFETSHVQPEPDGEPSSLPLSSRHEQLPRLREGVRMASFDHDVVALEAVIVGGQPDEAQPPRDPVDNAADAADSLTIPDPDVLAQADTGPCHLLLLPGDSHGGLGMVRVNAFTLALLERCDGQRPVASVIRDTCLSVEDAVTASAVATALDRLAARGVLTFQVAGRRSVQQPMNWLHSEVL